jgi:hypothetical protein
MPKGYSWTISRSVVQGRETYTWTVREPTDGKTVISGKEPSRAAALLAAMRAIQELEHPKKPKYE